jgi:hypothetical protein
LKKTKKEKKKKRKSIQGKKNRDKKKKKDIFTKKVEKKNFFLKKMKFSGFKIIIISQLSFFKPEKKSVEGKKKNIIFFLNFRNLHKKKRIVVLSTMNKIKYTLSVRKCSLIPFFNT